jgi:folate-binding protein YgfZ
MTTPNEIRGLLRLDHLAVIEFSGADATEFLNGQLSNDVAALAPGGQQLTSYSSPKGRVVAILTLARADERSLAVLPAELAGIVLERLRKYVLRSKVSLRLATELAVFGSVVDPARVAILPATETAAGSGSAASDAWKRAQIAAGRAQVYASTTEQFVAQMLNLDLVEGINFRKGCYTGQEIIARTQNLGRIKRRMLRLAVPATAALAVGDSVELGEFGPGMVVELAAAVDGERELLAVVHLEPEVRARPDERSVVVSARELALPYAVRGR